MYLTIYHYYPFGMLIPGRNASTDEYRFGFQGQEVDNEVREGEGNSLNYKYRMHDPRIGRFFAIDPLSPEYPWYTPYQFSGNKVIHAVELEGLEEYIFNENYRKTEKISLYDGKITFKVPSYSEMIQLDTDAKIYWFKWMAEDRFSKKKNNETIMNFRFNGQEYIKINSPMTIQGGDGGDGFDNLEDGNIFGLVDAHISKWKSKNWSLRNLTDPRNILAFKKASSSEGDLDFKYQLSLDKNTLYEINGTYYNRNEAGNFYWGYAAASLDLPLIALKLGGEIFTSNQGRNFDEPWEVDAYIDGYRWYHSHNDIDTYKKYNTDGNNIDIYNYENENTPSNNGSKQDPSQGG